MNYFGFPINQSVLFDFKFRLISNEVSVSYVELVLNFGTSFQFFFFIVKEFNSSKNQFLNSELKSKMAPPQWAYQVENFVSEPDVEFICSICHQVFCEPVMSPCDHVFCKGCISKWLQGNRNCPICRKRLSNSSIKQNVPIVKNLIMKLKLKCRNKSLGCNSHFSVESSENHMKQCEYEFVQCKNKPCKDKLYRKDIGEHEASDCAHRYIKCKTCGSKILSKEVPEEHDCIRALQLRLRKKTIIIRKRNSRIKELRNENKALKTAAENSRNHFTTGPLSNISPEDILINISEYHSRSSSSSSSSDSSYSDSSDESVIIFADSPDEQFDENAESGPFSLYENDQNDTAQETSEYRNAGSQTIDDNIDEVMIRSFDHGVNSNPTHENATTSVPDSAVGRTEERSEPRRQVKRRPTSQKPAKRRFPHHSPSSDDEESITATRQSPNLSSWHMLHSDENRGIPGINEFETAGPSSARSSVKGSSSTVADAFCNTELHLRSKAKLDERLSKQPIHFAGDMPTTSRVPGNAVFERTLALLEQYNIESDPDWLPQYASHTGDTPSESDSSCDMDESSSSDSCNSNMEDNSDMDNSGHNGMHTSNFLQWMFESTSGDDDEDPDWEPPIQEF